MATIDKYRTYIKQLFDKYGYFPLSQDETETQVIVDEQHDHYQLVHVGWSNNRRTYGCILHIDIKGDNIWIQHDGTEIGMANELVALGVPKTDIVLGFHASSKRPYTEFAVG